MNVFFTVRMWGGHGDLADAVQAAASVTVAAALVWLWRGSARFEVKPARC